MLPRNCLVALIAAGGLLAACGNSEEQTADQQVADERVDAFAASAEEGSLVSRKFGVSVTAPDDWNALDFDELNSLVSESVNTIASTDQEAANQIKANENNAYQLFMISQFEVGAPVANNPSLAGVAENVAHTPGIETGADYFFHMKNFLKQTGLDYEFGKNYGKRTIGGVEFDVLSVATRKAGQLVQQRYYATRHEDYVITFIESSLTLDGFDRTSEILDTVTLDW